MPQALQQTLDSPEVRSRMLQQGAEPAFLGPEAFGRFLRAELPRWERAVKASGARLDLSLIPLLRCRRSFASIPCAACFPLSIISIIYR